MITLAQGTTNLIAQFVRIVLKILVLHLHNQAKPFLDDIVIKKPKITYNNKKVTLDIRQSMHIYCKQKRMVGVTILD